MRTSTNVYLLVLSLADSVYLVMNIPLSLLSCSKPGMALAVYKFNPYGRFISNFSGNVAVWVTVVFTVERYLAVCHPIHGKVWCTVHRAKLASLAATLLVFINTLPTLFELEVVVEAAAAVTTTDRTTSFNATGSYSGVSDSIGASGSDSKAGGGSDVTPVNANYPSAYATATSKFGAWSEGYVARVDFANTSSESFSEMLTVVFTTPSLAAANPSVSEVVQVGDNGSGLEKKVDGKAGNPSPKVKDEAAPQSAGVPRCVETSMARQPSYMIGYSWWYVTVFAFVPMFFLAIFNTVLIRALIVAGRKRQQLALISTSTTPINGASGGNSAPRYSAFLKPDKKLSKKEQKLARKELKNLSTPCRDRNSGGTCDGLSTSQNSHGSFNEINSHTSISTTLTHKRQTRRISREQNKVTLLLVTIVMIFFLCQLPWTGLYLYKALGPEPSESGSIRLKIAGNVCNLLAIVNASVNFYLYSCFSKRFRRTLAKLVFCWRRKRNMSPTTV
ncbi:FMRFamide receptor [Elysia marginata]|uniref:FMRFamide receptor n=1 Tax=Elysia marginata TaxID=1093978 RepID=A0AAV4EUV4_9GAST|nr:FMRFamide receptor [Elysia marginata]